MRLLRGCMNATCPPKPANRRAGKRGSAMLEATFVTLAALTIILGIMDFARLIYAYNSMSSIARETSRFASVRGQSSGRPASASDIRSEALRQAIAMDTAAMNVTTAWSPDNKPGSTVAVTVTYTLQAMTPVMPAGLFTVASTSRSMISQ